MLARDELMGEVEDGGAQGKEEANYSEGVKWVKTAKEGVFLGVKET